GLVATKLTAGREIKIPVAPATAATTPGPAPATTASTPAAPISGPSATTPSAAAAVPASADVAASAEKTYVVKSGDTLSSIASHEMGSKKRWEEIAKANEDVLHGSTALKIGMKLHIPAAAAAAGTDGTSVASRDLAPAAGESAEREYVGKAGDSV